VPLPSTHVRAQVVVARLQAKWVRGGPAWPACTLRTIERCADELCGSMMSTLRTLPNTADRVRLLRWETFARRKQRVAADLLSWLGATANHSAVAELMVEVGPHASLTAPHPPPLDLARMYTHARRVASDARCTHAALMGACRRKLTNSSCVPYACVWSLQVEGELKAFKALSDKYPISPSSTFLVEQRCADVMQWLGYKPTIVSMPAGEGSAASAAVVGASGASSSTGARRYVERSSRRHARRIARLANASAAELADLANRPPTLLLRHTSKPKFAICPVRLAGTEPIMRFLVRRDTPEATTAPLCFPDNPSDRCPSRHGAKWHRSRWGSYPLEVLAVDADSKPSRGGFTFAFVRNPFDRLVSAYDRQIAAQTKETAVHRSWIRELHSLGDKDPITFSHFIRWVVQQVLVQVPAHPSYALRVRTSAALSTALSCNSSHSSIHTHASPQATGPVWWSVCLMLAKMRARV
jgi:hypothetical protein